MQTIRRYTDPFSAQSDQARLESSGVFVFLKNENMGTMAPIFSPANGGIELQVRESDVELALEILGPERNDPTKVAELSRELNKLFGFSLLVGIGSAFLHSWSQEFSFEAIDRTLMVGVAGCALGLVLFSLYKRVLKKTADHR